VTTATAKRSRPRIEASKDSMVYQTAAKCVKLRTRASIGIRISGRLPTRRFSNDHLWQRQEDVDGIV
jgi:hypothetical protein